MNWNICILACIFGAIYFAHRRDKLMAAKKRQTLPQEHYPADLFRNAVFCNTDPADSGPPVCRNLPQTQEKLSQSTSLVAPPAELRLSYNVTLRCKLLEKEEMERFHAELERLIRDQGHTYRRFVYLFAENPGNPFWGTDLVIRIKLIADRFGNYAGATVRVCALDSSKRQERENEVFRGIIELELSLAEMVGQVKLAKILANALPGAWPASATDQSALLESHAKAIQPL